MEHRALLLLPLVCFVACTAGQKHTQPRTADDQSLSGHMPAPAGRADQAVESLFEKLSKPKDSDQGARAAALAFAWGGMETRALKGVIQEAVPPLTPVITPDYIASRAARDYAKGPGAPRVSLEKIGQWLQPMRWPSGGPPPGTALALALAELVKAAKAHPEAPESFAPLFLSRSLKAGCGVDVSQSDVSPSDITLTILDLRLFLAAHIRGVEPKGAAPKKAAAALPAGARLAKTLTEGSPNASLPPGSSLPTICKDFMERSGWAEWLSHYAQGGMDLGTSANVAAMYRRLGIGDLMGSSIFGLLFALDQVISAHNNFLSFSLQSDGSTPHKPTPDGRPREARFTARALMTEAPSELERMARDCAKTMGFEVDTGGGDMDKWRVYWDEDKDFSDSATVPDRNDFDYANPLPGHNLRVRRMDENHKIGEAKLVVDIVEEEEHRAGGPVETKRAWVRAQLNRAVAAEPESAFGAILTGGTGLTPWGLAQDLIPVGKGLWLEFNPLVARAYVTVESCKKVEQEWTGNISFKRTTTQSASDPQTTDANGSTKSGSHSSEFVETVTIAVDGDKSTGTVSFSYTSNTITDSAHTQQCEFKKHAFKKRITIHGDVKQNASASGSGKVGAGATLSPDGSYVVSFTTPRETWGSLQVDSTHVQIGCQGRGSDNKSYGDRFKGVGFSYSAKGQASPGATSLSGNLSFPAAGDPPSPPGAPVIRVDMSWNLQLKQPRR